MSWSNIKSHTSPSLSIRVSIRQSLVRIDYWIQLIVGVSCHVIEQEISDKKTEAVGGRAAGTRFTQAVITATNWVRNAIRTELISRGKHSTTPSSSRNGTGKRANRRESSYCWACLYPCWKRLQEEKERVQKLSQQRAQHQQRHHYQIATSSEDDYSPRLKQ